MENNLDKYFKDKLHERKFDFKDSYWAGAEKLLDAQERRRRRGLLFWWFGGVAGIVLLAATFWFLGKHDGQQESQNHAVELKENTRNSPGANQAIKSNIPESELQENNDGNDNNIKAELWQQNENDDKKQEATKSQKPQSGKGSLKNQPPIATGFSQSTSPEKLGGNSNIIQENNSEIIAKNNDGMIETPSDFTNSNIPAEADLETAKRTLDDLTFLDLRQVLLYGDFTRPLKPKEAEAELKKQSPFSMGIMAAQSFQTNSKSEEKTIIGYQGGLVMQYKMNGPWHIGAGLQYRYRTGTFEASKSAIGRNYRFGLETDTFVLRPTSLHYLSLPLQLLWQRNRHVLEGGIAFDYLLGVRGEKGQYERLVEPTVHRAFVAKEKGWLVENGFKKINTTAQLGYRYRVNRQLSFGLNANYTFGGILKKDFEQPLSGGFLLKEADKFYLDLRAVYFIK